MATEKKTTVSQLIVDGLVTSKTNTSSSNTVSGATTLTTEQFLGGLVLHDPQGDVALTTPSAADIVSALGSQVHKGATIDLLVRNTADADETITLTAGSGVTISGTATIAQNNSKTLKIVVTNVTPSSEAVTVYSCGTSVH